MKPQIVVRKPGKLSSTIGTLFLIGLLGFILFGMYSCVVETASLKAFGESYVHALNEQRYDKAYEMLANETKQTMTLAQFEKSAEAVRLSKAKNLIWNQVSVSRQSCLTAGMTIDGELAAMTMYVLRVDDSFKMHTVMFTDALFKRPWSCFR